MVLDLSGRRVLVVEDEPLIAMDIEQALETAGASVVIAATLDEALRLTEHDGLSAAILDLVLGVSDGGALCARLREASDPLCNLQWVHGYPRRLPTRSVRAEACAP